jgi:TRAP-type C4-dicarboxylate transport system permease small subunit
VPGGAHPATRRLIERLFEWVTSALLVILALEVLVGIAFRAARRPLAWYDEVASVLLAWITYYGSALAALKNSHIGFPGLANALPRGGRLVILVIREVAVLGFFLVLAFEGTRILGLLAGETLVTVDVPVAVTQSVIPIGAVLFIIAELLVLPDRIAWVNGRAPSAPAGADAAKELSH